jgi:hypothetical protein
VSPLLTDYLVVIAMGAAVGLAELVSRYRDAPGRSVLKLPAFLYVGVNAGAAAAALALIRLFGWTFNIGAEGDERVRWTQVLLAGLGSMALFRSSLFVVRAGGQDIGVGFSSFLAIVLSAADREVDRVRAQARAKAVDRIMRDVSFDKAADALTTHCLALMQNLSEEDQRAVARQVAELKTSSMDEDVKALSLGLLLMNVVGEHVLAAAVGSLALKIKNPRPGS